MFQIEIKFMEHCCNHYCDFLSRSCGCGLCADTFEIEIELKELCHNYYFDATKRGTFLEFF